jgi:predicted RNase H-like HicB family nuclease
MKEWSEAILEAINSLGHDASLKDIYAVLEQQFPLSEQNLQHTRYGGRPAYQHEVRSFMSNLLETGELQRTGRGKYRLTPQGRARLESWMSSAGRTLHEPHVEYVPSAPRTYLLQVKVEPLEEGGYLAICDAIQGCHAEGESVAEALENVEDVARALLELRREDGLPVPEGIEPYDPAKEIKAQLVVAG